MVREVTDEDVGLKVLYDGMANDPPANGGKMFDIVAVHGMGAHPDDTWCKAVGPNDDRHYVNWLQERNMLPAAVPNARIMRYGYHSNWFGKDSISTRAYNISQRLLLTLTNKRNDNPTRPLIFIAHSFGGLVVLKVLLDAFLENKRWSSIYEYTIGLIFLGTPFRGTHDSMSQGEILQVAAKCFTDGTVHETNLKILRAGDETLVDLVDSYLRAARQKVMPKVACFFEQRVSPVGAIVGKSDEIKDVILVDESSGCLDINTSSDKYGLPRTHFTINKFGTPNEEDFVTLCSILQNMVKGGPALIKKRQSRMY
ncbi:hypothetical protein L228DRAFT_156852 [Xylona heveae TC161]|uniref:DUF676 domain-containing protein n=1 Tax=Xylona heveae (strain CBS 132557 / TC161) TaxID=1328760 RepID=A0A165G1X3_XYLHT|nr:hypothetical protein L228DRAFT_156852 [Xylona heveae TC161]KZF21644.1 hypothetical protein L228DRAFT_156852 [Xylona heveae TC161]